MKYDPRRNIERCFFLLGDAWAIGLSSETRAKSEHESAWALTEVKLFLDTPAKREQE